jgi:hypothetical protein
MSRIKKKRRRNPSRSLRRDPKERRREVTQFVESGGYQFWLAHGANYLNSSYDEGVWRPLFDVYEGEVFSRERLMSTVQVMLSDTPVLGGLLMAWCAMQPEKALHVRQEIIKGLTGLRGEELDTALVRPHVGTVWQRFAHMKKVAEASVGRTLGASA